MASFAFFVSMFYKTSIFNVLVVCICLVLDYRGRQHQSNGSCLDYKTMVFFTNTGDAGKFELKVWSGHRNGEGSPHKPSVTLVSFSGGNWEGEITRTVFRAF